MPAQLYFVLGITNIDLWLSNRRAASQTYRDALAGQSLSTANPAKLACLLRHC